VSEGIAPVKMLLPGQESFPVLRVISSHVSGIPPLPFLLQSQSQAVILVADELPLSEDDVSLLLLSRVCRLLGGTSLSKVLNDQAQTHPRSDWRWVFSFCQNYLL
jgi:hypothetical protein